MDETRTRAPEAQTSSGSEAALSVSSLSKSVGADRQLFSGLDLDVKAGELVAIVGESGVGKSTLLNILAGLDEPDAGEVRIETIALGALDETARTKLRRERIGFVFQAFHILPYLTLRQNVALPLALVSNERATLSNRADAMLEAVGLDSRGGDYARDLSGGEMQRVAIARALIHRPALILADEPTGNLDPETAGRILALFAERVRSEQGGERRSAAVIVTHSRATAEIADRVLVLTRTGLRPSA
ncbi:ABC transporter ATP-binding protein [Aureimonas ureilytica]|uniref:ABC transporter ATP-binding protein n=1 Tax=Aureimonas ureilytica TaxID=401562 RepID=A0A175RWA0_9HYPH|nr:ABC transporter ATP-binding protein [Aureimonas ureilytica]KTR07149.1 ABC transporter ATP-binding protein [Aureimonas ureilytica]